MCWILYICFNLVISYPYLLEIYTCRYEFIYTVYWKLCADHDLSYTLCVSLLNNRISLSP